MYERCDHKVEFAQWRFCEAKFDTVAVASAVLVDSFPGPSSFCVKLTWLYSVCAGLSFCHSQKMH